MAEPPAVKRQLGIVFDMNKCLGCQTCTIACKTLWTDEEGTDYMWWNIVSTMPGQGLISRLSRGKVLRSG